MTSKPKTILISGAGIAGPALALFLTNAGHTCTILERAPDFRTSGQQIDVAGAGLTVLRHLGLEDACMAQRVADDGIKFVDGDDKVLAAFGASSEAGALVKELEIMRPDLAGVVFEATKGKVEYRFGESVGEVRQDGQGVVVKFKGSGEERRVDVLVAADGLRSSTRDLAFGPDNMKFVTFNQYAGYFSMPWSEGDGSWSRWFNAPGGRCVVTRPDVNRKATSAYLVQIAPDADKVAAMAPEEQKQEFVKRFEDAGWESGRILKYLTSSSEGERFYCQEVAQTKSERLVKGRVALLGDSGYCPAPISGQGSSLALVGAYILAGCICTHDDVEDALLQYEKEVRPFVDVAQDLPPGTPWIVNPQSAWGITALSLGLRFAHVVVASGVGGLIGRAFSPIAGWVGKKEPTLPEYPMVHSRKD